MQSKPFTVVLKDIVATGSPGMTQQQIENAVTKALEARLMVDDHEGKGVQVPIVPSPGHLVMVDQVTIGHHDDDET